MHFCSVQCLLRGLSISSSFIFSSEQYMVTCTSHKAPNCASFSIHLLSFSPRPSYFPQHLIFENLIPSFTIQNHKKLIFLNFTHVCLELSYIYCIVLTMKNSVHNQMTVMEWSQCIKRNWVRGLLQPCHSSQFYIWVPQDLQQALFG